MTETKWQAPPIKIAAVLMLRRNQPSECDKCQTETITTLGSGPYVRDRDRMGFEKKLVRRLLSPALSGYKLIL
ncbi:MAG: hypothetical protein P8Y53_10225 [Pseudolabrys sp.]